VVIWVCFVQCVPLATKPAISLIILPLIRILQRNLKRTTDTLLFISHTKNVLLFKFHCNIFIGVRIIKEMPGSVASRTHCISFINSGEICYLQLQGTSELFKTVKKKTACSPETLLTISDITQSHSPENHVNFHTCVI